ncbi:MAG TPA: hypothetical protein VLM79_08915 [Kofleriaceae bacterium]|nr:hypothetical protein [Kofleriaceae bacterium]
MASLRDQLVHALDIDPPNGWLHSGPLAQAMKVARGREADTLREALALLADPRSSPRLRRNAVPLLAQLYIATVNVPSAEEIYDAAQRGERFDPQRALKQALERLLGDGDLEVRIAAAVELLQVANPADLPPLRAQLTPLLPALRQRRGDSPQVQQALLALGGAPDVLAQLSEIAGRTGPLPAELEIVLGALERDPHPAAAPLLARMFPRLDAIAERRDPVREVIGGAIPAWDARTNQAVMLFKLHIRLVPVAQVAAAVALLRAATPAMAAVLVASAADLQDRGVALGAAAALDSALPLAVRRAAVELLGRFARTSSTTPGLAAVERLQRLRADPALAEDAERALSGVGAAKS